jgi:hypothetical protein
VRAVQVAQQIAHVGPAAAQFAKPWNDVIGEEIVDDGAVHHAGWGCSHDTIFCHWLERQLLLAVRDIWRVGALELLHLSRGASQKLQSVCFELVFRIEDAFRLRRQKMLGR